MRLTQTAIAGAVFAAAALSASSAASQTAQAPHQAHEMHADTASYIAALEDPARDAWQKPEQVLEALGVTEGQRIADIGAGSGYFALRLAQRAGASGRVFAVDISREMLAHLESRANKAGLSNIDTILAPPDDPNLPAASIDLVFFCDVWHHIDDQAGYLEKLKRALRPSGQIVMIDFQKRELPVGPPADMKIARDDLVRQLAAHGFRLAREHTFLPYQYFLVFVLQ
jgi:arsenite methyltransferase